MADVRNKNSARGNRIRYLLRCKRAKIGLRVHRLIKIRHNAADRCGGRQCIGYLVVHRFQKINLSCDSRIAAAEK